MFFSQSKNPSLRHTASNSVGPPGPVEILAKCLHLQEVMCQKNTGNYSIMRELLQGAKGSAANQFLVAKIKLAN
jgi:hypothetical protein